MDLIKKAIIDYTTVLKHFRDRKLWILLVIPGLISFVLGALFLYAAYLSGTAIADFLSDLYPFEFGKRAAFTFFHLIPFTYLFAIMIVKYVIFIAISPFMNLLSIRIEKEYLMEEKRTKDLVNIKSFLRVLTLAGQSFYKEVLWTILFCLIGLIVPVAGIAGIFIAQSYYIGICHLGFTLGRKKSFHEMQIWFKSNRGLPLGNGFIYITLIFIPLLGILLAPVASTAAGTISVLDEV